MKVRTPRFTTFSAPHLTILPGHHDHGYLAHDVARLSSALFKHAGRSFACFQLE
jgi:hypothetical protein